MPNNDNPIIIHTGNTHTASVIWLHGLGADGNDFVPVVPELNLPTDAGIKFIFPHAPMRPITINGGMIMRAWYDVRAMDLTAGEDSEGILDSARIIDDLISSEADKISSKRIILAGFSQGGAMTLHTGLRYLKSLAGLLALSAYLPLASRLVKEAHDANRETPILMMHGVFDPVIPIISAEHSRKVLVADGYSVDWQKYNMQHSVCPQQIDYIGRWLCEKLAL